MMAARSTLVLAAAFLLAGAALDSPSLYVPGVALGLLVAASRLWVGLAARGAQVERERGPWSIVEGDPYPLNVLVHSARLPLPGGWVAHPLVDRSETIGIRRSRRVFMEVRSLRRGRRRLEPVALLVSDPLRLHTAEVRSERDDHVLVLPRVEAVTWRGGRAGGSGDGVDGGLEGLGPAGPDTRAIDFEVDGLRPYRHGSPASRIHWPTVARIGEVVEHRLVAGADSSPLVVLDSSNPVSEEALDRAVRATASLCLHLARFAGCALLLSGERRRFEIDSKLRSWPQAHARLAVVEAGGPAPAIRQALRAERTFWVTAAEVPPAPTPGLAGYGFYVVTPSPLSGLVPAFTVAGCHGHRLGSVLREGRTAAASA